MKWVWLILGICFVFQAFLMWLYFSESGPVLHLVAALLSTAIAVGNFIWAVRAFQSQGGRR